MLSSIRSFYRKCWIITLRFARPAGNLVRPLLAPPTASFQMKLPRCQKAEASQTFALLLFQQCEL